MNIEAIHKKFIECSQEISTDSRIVTPGSMFFAWKGENGNGNDYVQQALDKGAKYVVCDDIDAVINDSCILVPNTIEALQGLARFHRSQFNVPVVAIGGSNGKTTTKELLACMVRDQKDTVASFGSLNNHTGVPLTLLRMTQYTDIVILEVGANHVGEIIGLCKIAEPTHGLITNIGRDHIGFFGSTDAIVEANLELYKYLEENDGFAFVNKNDKSLYNHTAGLNHICYGVGLSGENGLISLNSIPYISAKWKHHILKTHLTGEYNLENIIAGISVARHFNIQEKMIINGIENYIPSNNRSEIVHTDSGNILIKDFYNANRSSMELALDNLAQISSKYLDHTSVAILGDMLELGDYSKTEHQAIVDYAMQLDVDQIILIGPDFERTEHKNITSYPNVESAISYMKEQVLHKKIVLLKASNGTNFQKLFNEINW